MRASYSIIAAQGNVNCILVWEPLSLTQRLMRLQNIEQWKIQTQLLNLFSGLPKALRRRTARFRFPRPTINLFSTINGAATGFQLTAPRRASFGPTRNRINFAALKGIQCRERSLADACLPNGRHIACNYIAIRCDDVTADSSSSFCLEFQWRREIMRASLVG